MLSLASLKAELSAFSVAEWAPHWPGVASSDCKERRWHNDAICQLAWGHRDLNPDPLVSLGAVALQPLVFRAAKNVLFANLFFLRKGFLEPAALPGYAMTPFLQRFFLKALLGIWEEIGLK